MTSLHHHQVHSNLALSLYSEEIVQVGHQGQTFKRSLDMQTVPLFRFKSSSLT